MCHAVGRVAEPASDGLPNDDAVPDQVELDEVRWFTREETRAVLRGEVPDAKTPGPLAIAHQLIKSWAEEEP